MGDIRKRPFDEDLDGLRGSEYLENLDREACDVGTKILLRNVKAHTAGWNKF